MLMNSITMMMQLEFEGRLTGFQLGLSILAAVSSAPSRLYYFMQTWGSSWIPWMMVCIKVSAVNQVCIRMYI